MKKDIDDEVLTPKDVLGLIANLENTISKTKGQIEQNKKQVEEGNKQLDFSHY